MKRNLPVKITIFVLAYIFIYHSAKAQNSTPAKADSAKTVRAQTIYAEFGGPGLFVSANYDTRFSQQRGGLGGRIGLGFAPPVADYGVSLIIVPVQVNYLLGKKSNFFEIGLGATFVTYSNSNAKALLFNKSISNHSILGTMTFGYRYQPINGGFNFRAGLNPVFYSSTFEPFKYFGLSFGYTFK